MKKLAIAILVLALVGIATANELTVTPTAASIAPGSQITLSAYCNQTPCQIEWTQLWSNSIVGTINNTAGPQTTFQAGSVPGTAIVKATNVAVTPLLSATVVVTVR